MNHAAIASVKAALKDEDDSDVPMPDVRRLIQKSMLLNLGVVASAVAVAIAGPGQKGATSVGLLVLLTTLLIWVATFLASLLLLIVANFRRIGRLMSRRPRRGGVTAGPLADDWLDGPGS